MNFIENELYLVLYKEYRYLNLLLIPLLIIGIPRVGILISGGGIDTGSSLIVKMLNYLKEEYIMYTIFVYGTLLNGERNHNYLNEADLIYKHAWMHGKLYDTNCGYPVVKPDNKEKVYGEVYRITDKQLKMINELEGYQENGTCNLYERITTVAYNDLGESIKVLTYVTGRVLENAIDVIAFGNWKVYTYLQQKPVYYFAYGSCMDNERFKLANVSEYFSSIKGKGVLEKHGFRFSKSTDDGGKADIIEALKEEVEGVVYQIHDEAIEYLYEREGVHTDGYRPAIVSLKLQNEFVEALTFIGITKEQEMKPTIRYANEIIRGATGVLSKLYIKKLKMQINKLME